MAVVLPQQPRAVALISMIFTLPASPWPYRIVNTALLAALAWFAAALIWWLIAPRPTAPAAAPKAASTIASGNHQDLSALLGLFAQPATPSATAMAASTLNYKLRGVIAASGTQPAAAILQGSGPTALAVKLGGEVEPGVTLREVAADHVMLDNRGRQERIDLDAKPAASLGGAMPSAVSTAAGPQPGSRFNTPVSAASDERTLSRQQLAAGLQSLNVADWAKGLSDAPGGGILVDNAGAQPIAPMLALQSGDVLKSVNGALMSKTNDISMLYGAFTRESMVTVSLIRNATVMNFKFRILK